MSNDGEDIGGGWIRKPDGRIVGALHGDEYNPALHGLTPGQVHSFDHAGKPRDVFGFEAKPFGASDPGSDVSSASSYSSSFSASATVSGRVSSASEEGGIRTTPAFLSSVFGRRLADAPRSLKLKSWALKIPLRLLFGAVVFGVPLLLFGSIKLGGPSFVSFTGTSTFTDGGGVTVLVIVSLVATLALACAEALIERLVGRRVG